MQIQLKAAVCILMLAILGCFQSDAAATSASAPTPPPFDRLVLRDVQGLWGGQDLWLYADCRLVVQLVKSPNADKGMQRYETTATAGELNLIQTLLKQHHFSDLKIAARAALPDESHPTISVETAGTTISVTKQGDDKNADFDPVYDQLLVLVKLAAVGKPIYEGRYDWDWAPQTTSAHTDDEYAAHVAHIQKALPTFTVAVQKPFVVAGDDTREKVRDTGVATVKWAVEHLKKDYFDKDPVDLIDIYLFKDKTSYDKYTKEYFHDLPTTPWGYYSPTHKALIMNISTGGGTLVHEIVHPFMAANFPSCPTWFNEGLASLYEQSMDKEGHIWGLPNWRLNDLQETLTGKGPPEEGGAPPFKDLCNMDPVKFYGPHKGPNYGVARYLCLYLQEKGVLRQFYKDFVKNQKADPTGYDTLQKTLAGVGDIEMDAFRKKWEAWVMGLKYP